VSSWFIEAPNDVRFHGIYCYKWQSTTPFIQEDGKHTHDGNCDSIERSVVVSGLMIHDYTPNSPTMNMAFGTVRER